MLRNRLTHEPPSPNGRALSGIGDGGSDQIESVQLARLASAVLSKSPADLIALAESNPQIIWEWLEAFRRQKLKAEAESRFWSAAMAILSTAVPAALRSAAE